MLWSFRHTWQLEEEQTAHRSCVAGLLTHCCPQSCFQAESTGSQHTTCAPQKALPPLEGNRPVLQTPAAKGPTIGGCCSSAVWGPLWIDHCLLEGWGWRPCQGIAGVRGTSGHLSPAGCSEGVSIDSKYRWQVHELQYLIRCGRLTAVALFMQHRCSPITASGGCQPAKH